MQAILQSAHALWRTLDSGPKLALCTALVGVLALPTAAQECGLFSGTPPWVSRASSCVDVDSSTDGRNGRVAIIVDQALYDDHADLRLAISTYACDLVSDGYSHQLQTFQGSAADLRHDLQVLYRQPLSLKGAVLVGGALPWALFCQEGRPYPCEAYLMDIDDEDWPEDASGWIIQSEWPGDRQAQIWVSRIKADNLPEIAGTEAEIIQQYLLRNHELRCDAFNPDQRALVYARPQEFCPAVSYEDPATAMELAFRSVDKYCYDQTSAEDYIARLGRTGLPPPDPAPEPYDYILEINHGGQYSHSIGSGAVFGSDYLSAGTRAIGIWLVSCGASDFSWLPYTHPELGPVEDARGYVAGDACFAPLANTLVVSGYSCEGPPETHPYALWTTVGAGHSYGEGYLSEFNAAPILGMVLIGDGSIKGTSYDWTGQGDGINWNNRYNWADSRVPGSADNPDRVRIDAAEVVVDSTPNSVWSIDLRNGGGLTLTGAGTELIADTSLLADEPSRNTLHMTPWTTLRLGEQGSLLNTRVVMDATTDGTTNLSVGRVIDNCMGVRVGTNCRVGATNLRRSSFDVVEGTVNAGVVGHCPSITLDSGGVLCAGSIENSSLTVPAGTVTADRIQACTIQVASQGSVIAGAVAAAVTMVGGHLSVLSRPVDAGTYVVCAGSVTAPPGICGGDWNLSGSELTAGPSGANGNWTFTDESVATFEELSSVGGGSKIQVLALTLGDSSWMTLERTPLSTTAFCDDSWHRMIYGAGDNRFLAGSADNGERFYIGNKTVVAGAADDAQLDLLMRSSLAIASDFQQVAADWDSTGVDTTMIPMHTGAAQKLELISPSLAVWYSNYTPVVFVDVPCTGALRDLDIEGAEASGQYAEVDIVNEYDNSAIDEGPASSWTPPDGPGPAEAGIYRCVAIGGNREVYFSAGSVIYYWGAMTFYPSTTVYQVQGGHTVAVPASAVLRHAVGTYYGDFNGDCQIDLNNDLRVLQVAIAGGPSSYNGRFDADCDGLLSASNFGPELKLFWENYRARPGCAAHPCTGEYGAAGSDGLGESFAAADGAEGGAAAEGDGGEPLDLSAVAASLTAELTEGQIAEFVADLRAAAAAGPDDSVGIEMAEFLSYFE